MRHRVGEALKVVPWNAAIKWPNTISVLVLLHTVFLVDKVSIMTADLNFRAY